MIHALVIADRNAMRTSLCVQLARQLTMRGLQPSQYRFHTHRTVEDALSQMLGNPPYPTDLIVCWDNQPARAGSLHGRPACSPRSDEGARMGRVLSLFPSLRAPIITVRASTTIVPPDEDPTGTPAMHDDPLSEFDWFAQEDTRMIGYSEKEGTVTFQRRESEGLLDALALNLHCNAA
jgi:hypothetical protein